MPNICAKYVEFSTHFGLTDSIPFILVSHLCLSFIPPITSFTYFNVTTQEEAKVSINLASFSAPSRGIVL